MSADPVAVTAPHTSAAPAARDARERPRVVSLRRVAFGAFYWLGWILGSRRTVVTTGIARELEAIGIGAVGLVASASVLVGLIATFQIAYQLQTYGAQVLSANAIGWFAPRELGPVVVALLVVTRSASAIAGELGAMSANAEIDALRAMGLDPIKYLVAPKLAALLLALPALTIIADALITIGGWIGCTFFLGLDTRFYLEAIRTSLALRDVAVGVGKAFLFGAIITVVATYEGLNVSPGVGEIGEGASRSVVYCLLGVLAADTLVNAIFYFIPSFLL